MREIVIAGAVRTAIGDFGGGLRSLSPHESCAIPHGIGPLGSEALEWGGARSPLERDAGTQCGHDIERIEINEAFAAPYLACERQLGLDRERVNVHGNGIALGHPVRATGCRLAVTLLCGLMADKMALGVDSLRAGGGISFACLPERN